MNRTLGQITYGAFFCLVLPASLATWCAAVEPRLALPTINRPLAGAAFGALGLALIAVSTAHLVIRGGGWPMNAFPPVRLVMSGPYAWIENPIYWGFVFIIAGGAIGFGSAAALWIALPTAALGITALVVGYERDATQARFGRRHEPPLLALPPALEAPARWNDRASIAALLGLWAVLYEWLGHVPVPSEFSLWMGWELRAPVLTWTEAVYVLAYPAGISCVFVVGTRADARRFAETTLVACLLGALCYLAIPAVSPPRPFAGDGLLADLLAAERADGLNGRASFPSFHVYWACVAASVWSRRFSALRLFWWFMALAISASCWMTGMHPLADIAAGFAFWWLVARWREVVQNSARATERIANGWREWHFGPLRIISHGLFAGAGAAIGMLGTQLLAGPDRGGPLSAVAVLALLGAALWGQYFVGGATLLRPFGYFGSILGASVGIAVLVVCGWLSGDLAWRLAAAIAAIAPLVQAIGRLRCLVQGCCHGRPTNRWYAIRYRHPRSRVCRLAHLEGVPVHPTPLYSIAGNLALSAVFIRLSLSSIPCEFLVGGYLVGSGLLRFIEEHFRGEPQTPVVGGLRLYQWFAITSVFAGFIVSAVPSGVRTASSLVNPTLSVWVTSVVIGLAYWFAMGVDFPNSNRRFSRLA